MDLLDDIFSEPSTVKAPVRAKFQPKAKPRPQKGPSSAGSTHAALATKEQAIPSTLAHSDSNGNLAVEVKDVGSLVTGHSEIAMSKTSGDGCLSPGITLGSQGAEDVIGQKTKEDMHMLDASATQAAEDTSGFSNLACASSSPFRPCSGDGLRILATNQESRLCKETVVGCAGDFQIDMQQETVDFSFLEVVDITSDAVAPSGNRAVKFQPKPKGQRTRKTNTAVVVSHLPDAANVPSENEHINGDGFICAGEPVTVSDLSHVSLDDDFGTEATIVQLDTVVLDDVDSVVTLNFSKESGNNEKRKTSDAEAFSHSLDEGGISLGVEATEDGYGYLDGVNDEIQFNSCSPAEAINEVAANSDGYNDDCHSNGETSENRLQNSEKVSSGSVKPSRKRRNEAKPPEESTKKARKKFPHTTRRKRSVDKSLLEAPDEIELRKVPMRDLIILSEYKEREANKQAAVVQPPTTSERRENTLPEDPTYNEDEAYGSDQGTDSFDNPSTSRIIKDTGYFNYQSYMDRKHKRWSKHETELFYQGLQEFGSDFTMIQQRYFPDRSRHQIKLKYKKEEREQPMRIHDALTTRAKDLSHFEVLIQKLQEQEQAGRENAEQSGDDNLIGSTFEEDGGGDGDTHETHATSKEAAEPEQNGGSAALNERSDNTVQVESPAKSYDSEEEFDWNEYKSEL